MQQREGMFSTGKAYTRAGFAFLTFLAGLVVGAVPLSYLAYYLSPGYQENGYAIVLNYVAMYLVGFPLYLLVFRFLPAHSAPRAAQPKKLPPVAIVALYTVCYAIVGILGTFSNHLNNWIGKLLDNGYSAETVTDLSGQNMLVLFITGVIIAPVMEEIIFRAIPYRKLSGYGQRAYILFTSIVFGLFHLNLVQFFYATVLGLLFAKITWDTGSVRYTVILHVMVNLTGGVGIGSLLLRYGGEKASQLYGYAVLALMLIGTVTAIVWCVRNRALLRESLPPHMPKGELRKALLAPGCVVYYLVCILLIVTSIVTTALV